MAPNPPTNITFSEGSDISITWEYKNDWFAFYGDDSSFSGFNEGVWSDGRGDVRIERRDVDAGTSFSSIVTGLSPRATSYTDTTSFEQDTTYEYRITRYIDSSTTASTTAQITTYLNETRSIGSYATPSSSISIREVSLLESVTSTSSSLTSSSKRVTDVKAATFSSSQPMSSSSIRSSIAFESRESDPSYSQLLSSNSKRVTKVSELVQSYSSPLTSTSTRGALAYENREGGESYADGMDSNSIRVIDLLEDVSSHSSPSSSFTYNERTSLELIDHEISWKDEEANWYTNWFQETRILGSEDRLGVRSSVVDNAKEPCAIVVLQYDSNGNGKIDAESDAVELGRDEEVKIISGVPIDEDGYYRLKITEYSGYNSLYALDTAIIH